MSKYPSIIFPDKSQEYKVMQFTVGDDFYMRFALTPTFMKAASHPDIVEFFAKEIDAKIRNTGSWPYNTFHFLENSNKIIGAGACDIYLEDKVAIFGAMSANYDIRIDVNHMNEVAKSLPDWKFLHNKFYTRETRDLFPEYKKHILKL